MWEPQYQQMPAAAGGRPTARDSDEDDEDRGHSNWTAISLKQWNDGVNYAAVNPTAGGGYAVGGGASSSVAGGGGANNAAVLATLARHKQQHIQQQQAQLKGVLVGGNNYYNGSQQKPSAVASPLGESTASPTLLAETTSQYPTSPTTNNTGAADQQQQQQPQKRGQSAGRSVTFGASQTVAANNFAPQQQRYPSPQQQQAVDINSRYYQLQQQAAATEAMGRAESFSPQRGNSVAVGGASMSQQGQQAYNYGGNGYPQQRQQQQLAASASPAPTHLQGHHANNQYQVGGNGSVMMNATHMSRHGYPTAGGRSETSPPFSSSAADASCGVRPRLDAASKEVSRRYGGGPDARERALDWVRMAERHEVACYKHHKAKSIYERHATALGRNNELANATAYADGTTAFTTGSAIGHAQAQKNATRGLAHRVDVLGNQPDRIRDQRMRAMSNGGGGGRRASTPTMGGGRSGSRGVSSGPSRGGGGGFGSSFGGASSGMVGIDPRDEEYKWARGKSFSMMPLRPVRDGRYETPGPGSYFIPSAFQGPMRDPLADL